MAGVRTEKALIVLILRLDHSLRRPGSKEEEEKEEEEGRKRG